MSISSGLFSGGPCEFFLISCGTSPSGCHLCISDLADSTKYLIHYSHRLATKFLLCSFSLLLPSLAYSLLRLDLLVPFSYLLLLSISLQGWKNNCVLLTYQVKSKHELMLNLNHANFNWQDIDFHSFSFEEMSVI